MMDRLGLDAVLAGRLGGWTQTALTMGTEAQAQATRELRMLRGMCLICGLHGCSAGAHKPENTSTAKRKELPLQDIQLSTKRVRSQLTADRVENTSIRATSAEVNKAVPVVTRSYWRIRALGQDYTTLTWFFKKKANDAQTKKAIEQCAARALEFSGGDSKTLLKREFVSKAEIPPPDIWPSRRNLPSAWTATTCLSLRGGEHIFARHAGDIENCRQMFFLCASLEAVFQRP